MRMRVLMSISSLNISRKPPTFSWTLREKPILNVRGTNFSIDTLPPRIPPVVRKEVMAKLMAFWVLVKESCAASGPPKQSAGSGEGGSQAPDVISR